MKLDNYLGLDLSLTGTGIVVLDAAGKVIKSSTIKTQFKGMMRLTYIRNQIAGVIDLYQPKTICIEGYSMGSRAGQAFSIGELGGVIKAFLYEVGYTTYLIPPSRLKKFIVGGGRAEKDMIMMKVYKNWGWEPSDNNVADAYGLCRIAMELAKPSNGLNKAQQEVIHDILHPPAPKK